MEPQSESDQSHLKHSRKYLKHIGVNVSKSPKLHINRMVLGTDYI